MRDESGKRVAWKHAPSEYGARVIAMDRAVMNFVILGLCIMVTALAHFGADYESTENPHGKIVLVFSWLAVLLLLVIAVRGMLAPNVP